MRRNMYVAYECLAEKVSGQFLCELESINHIEAHVNGSYPIRYKNEPPYPYIFVQLDVINGLGNRNLITYCYYGWKIEI